MCACVRAHVCACAYVRAHVCTRVRGCACAHVCVHVCAHACVHARVCACIVCIWVFVKYLQRAAFNYQLSHNNLVDCFSLNK